jgi:putative ABC transport system ATP-binding protein
MTPKRIVGLSEVRKRYAEAGGEHEVLKGVDLELAPGEFVALLGRSGSGKSTLLHLIAGIDRPSSGSIEVFGEDLTRAGEERRTAVRRERIGLVFQSYNLLPTLTVEENLLLPLELTGTRTRASRARAGSLLERVGLADKGSRFPDRLSGGEQQRAAVARALVHDPDLVLADEPTGNLDDQNARAVLELFRGLLRPAGKTLVIATHSVLAAEIADRVLELRDGRLIERGAPA